MPFTWQKRYLGSTNYHIDDVTGVVTLNITNPNNINGASINYLNGIPIGAAGSGDSFVSSAKLFYSDTENGTYSEVSQDIVGVSSYSFGWYGTMMTIPYYAYKGASRYFKLRFFSGPLTYYWTAPFLVIDNLTIDITSQPSFSSNNVQFGTNETLAVAATSQQTLSYQWKKDGTNISGATTNSLTLSNIGQSDVANYSVVVSSQYNSVTSNEVFLSSSNSLPVFTAATLAQNRNLSFVLGGTAPTLSAEVINSTGVTYQWQKNGVDQSGAVSSSYTPTIASAGTYTITAVVTNSAGSVTMQAFTITVTHPLTITAAPEAEYVLNSGVSSTITVSAVGQGTLSYQWKKGTTTVGLNSSSFTIASPSLSDAGSYSVTVTDSADGSTQIRIFSIVVHSPPVFSSATLADPTTKTAVFEVINTYPTLSVSVDNPTGVTYSWHVNDISQNNGVSSYTYQPATADTYSIKVIASNTYGNTERTYTVSYTQPTAANFDNGDLPSTVNSEITIGGKTHVARALPIVSGESQLIVLNDPTRPSTILFSGIDANVQKVGIAVPPVEMVNGVAKVVLQINMFASDGSKIHDFSANPVTMTIDMPSSFIGNTITVTTKDDANNVIDTNIFTKVNGTLTNEYTGTLKHFSTQEATDNPPQSVPCFTAGTRIKTTNGLIPVEKLSPSDKIVTADGRAVPFKLYTTTINKTTASTAPYTIPANMFGRNSPAADITISPLHAIQSRKGVWQIPKYAAKEYEAIKQVNLGSQVTYYHIELPNFFTDNIVAEGTIVESYGANQTKGLQNVYKYNHSLKGFTRISPPSQSKHVPQ